MMPASSSSPSPSQPPPPNPILTAYENFQNDTPIMTRYILTTYTASYLLSTILVPSFVLFAVLNIPYFTIFHGEIYRVVTTLFVCTSFLNLVFGWVVLYQTGRRVEQSLGSTVYGVLVACLGVVSQLVFVAGAGMVYFLKYVTDADTDGSNGSNGSNTNTVNMTGSTVDVLVKVAEVNHSAQKQGQLGRDAVLMIHNYNGGGLWILIFGLMALECAYEYRTTGSSSTRRLFLMQVPTLYYPMTLLALFMLFGGTIGGTAGGLTMVVLGHLPEITSMSIGYAIGLGKLRLEQLISSERRKRAEEVGFVRALTTRVGFVVGPPPSSSSSLVLVPPLSQPSLSSSSASSSSAVSRFGNRSVDEEQGWRPSMMATPESTLGGSRMATRRSNGTSSSSQSQNVPPLSSPSFPSSSALASSSVPLDQQQQRGRDALLAAAERRAKNMNNQ